MDKQEAIAFILREYAQGAKPADIALRLSVLIGAPSELTNKFVAQAIAQHAPAATQREIEATVHTTVQRMNSGQPAVSSPAPEPFPLRPLNKVEPTPPLRPSPVQPPPENTWQPAQSTDESPPWSSPQASPPSWSPQPASAPSWQPPVQAASSQSDPELEAFILRALTKTSKQSDVVMLACERANLSWDEAQRLVARIATQNRNKLIGRQNRIIIPLAIIAILVGLLLVYAGLREVLSFATAIKAIQAGDPAAIPIEARDPMRNAPWAILFGSGITLGGVFGLVKAIKAQVDA